MKLAATGRLARKIHVFGDLFPLIVFHVIMAAISCFLFDFDGRLMFAFLCAALIAMAVVAPLTLAVTAGRARRLLRAVDAFGAGEREQDAAEARRNMGLIDGFPQIHGRRHLRGHRLGRRRRGAARLLLGRLQRPLLTIIFVFLALDGAIGCSYLEFFLQCQFLEPVGKMVISLFDHPEHKGSSSLVSRIVALPVILTLTAMVLGWSAAASRSIFGTQKNSL